MTKTGTNYPTDILTDDGWGRVHRGHGLDTSVLLADFNATQGPTGGVRVKEVHLFHQPRVRWCERHGDPCELNGEWHGHWHAVRPGSGTAFTIAHADGTVATRMRAVTTEVERRAGSKAVRIAAELYRIGHPQISSELEKLARAIEVGEVVL
jgi:hypothetical protein